MARQQVIPGGHIEALTPEEAAHLVQGLYRQDVAERVRAPATIALDATGGGVLEVYSPPVGFEFEARRITLDLSTATDPATGAVALGAGKTVEYLRSGTRIEWGQPSAGGAPQVPGGQTWGAEQGPYIRNGEVFEVRARGLTANATLDVTVEGILRRPAKPEEPGHHAPMSADKRPRFERAPRPGPS